MVVHMQVLSVQSVEMAPSLMLATETQRFLFNVGDGTQRMCMEHHVRLAKLRNVFLTELRTHTLGGLPGMILTVSDTGKDAMYIHGPEGTSQYMHATRHFLFRPNFKLEAKDVPTKLGVIDHKPAYEDEEVKVYAIPVRARAGAKRKLNDTAVVTETGANDCVSYIVETLEQRGKFLVEKAVALGVPKGRLFGDLHKGKDVTLPDGRVVRSADCVSPSSPGAGCAIVACPSKNYVEELTTSPLYRRYQQHAATQDGKETMTQPELQLQVVYHLGDASVLQHPSYIEWIKRFGDDVEHVLLNYSGCPEKTVYRDSAKLQAQLHSVFPDAFPSNDYELRDAETPFTRRVDMPFTSKPVIIGESMLKYTLTPTVRRGFDATHCFQRLNYDEIQQSTASFRETLTQSEAAAATTADALAAHLIGRLTFLGTGCAIPSKYRNVTGILLEFPSNAADASAPWHGMMLDCGEGSLGQLYRYAQGDMTKYRALLKNLKCIWISHNHADHHLGIARILSQRTMEDEADEPLTIIGPTPVEWWLKEYAQVDPTIVGKYTYVDNFHFDQQDDRFTDSVPAAKLTRVWLQDALQISEFECVRVKHAFRAYAVVFTWQNALKIVFSGDCRPSDQLAEKAKDAFLFIHEATFEEGMDTEAKQKDHSTTAEAMAVGQKAHAKHLILTHFSQRYPKMPALDASGLDDAMCAMDLLSLRFSDLHRMASRMELCMQIVGMDEDDNAQDE
ncbi:hypothetical protein Poli38472_013194 [Pythium oligandrum]|uniref:ribonuclease Z n=1 Tax=Pythium oligandrum TaxID=41045 RepID=A0A8K1FDX3_PYTOL|nr:hypothetical protein Poli38472_013194 [Pythium oligandrum]|eukprot:TMW55303.1 hypothetical protein Poli38472_013194 [Pythium oligandrum]